MTTSGEHGSGSPAFGGADFERLTRQYWNAWGDAMRAGTSPPPTQAMPDWSDPLNWWSQLARGGGFTPPGVSDDPMARFNVQAQQWFAQMQQLASQFAGQRAGATEIAAAWQRMVGGDSARALTDLFRHMHGAGPQGVEPWMAHMAPLLRSMQGEARQWLGLPAFGFAREHQERWQALAQAQLDFQEKYNAYNALLAEATQQAFRRFEEKLKEREEAENAIPSGRALFDLWIDAAEDAYADIAMSPRFGEAYGDMVNAQMRVRAGLQREVEQYCAQLGIPTRGEVDAAHRKIVQLERELRRLRDAARSTATGAASKSTSDADPDTRPDDTAARAERPSTKKPAAKKTGKETRR